MSTLTKAESDLATLQSDFATLKHDLASLIAHLKAGAVSGTQAAAARIDGDARDVWHGIAARSERGYKTVSGHVEKQPVGALLIFAAIGYLGGRFLSR